MKNRVHKIWKHGWKEFCALALCMGVLAGCGGNSDAIKEETKKAVTDKTNEALTLYADLEKLVEENELTADKSFTDMKKQLTDMSVRIKAKLDTATETDANGAVTELDGIIENLNSVKKKVETSIEDVE